MDGGNRCVVDLLWNVPLSDWFFGGAGFLCCQVLAGDAACGCSCWPCWPSLTQQYHLWAASLPDHKVPRHPLWVPLWQCILLALVVSWQHLVMPLSPSTASPCSWMGLYLPLFGCRLHFCDSTSCGSSLPLCFPSCGNILTLHLAVPCGVVLPSHLPSGGSALVHFSLVPFLMMSRLHGWPCLAAALPWPCAHLAVAVHQALPCLHVGGSWLCVCTWPCFAPRGPMPWA